METIMYDLNDLVVLDCEVYPNYFLVAFKHLSKQTIITLESKGENTSLSEDDRQMLFNIMHGSTTFGFNSNNYDLPIILYALKNATCKDIYGMSQHIIGNKFSQGWMTLRDYGLRKPNIRCFDIQEPAPGVRISLKIYGGRIHSKILQDLPIEPGTTLTGQQMATLKDYCINDLNTTIDLYEKIKDRIQLRADMSEKYNEDLMSKSDAQIAEAVIKSEIGNKNMSVPKLPADVCFNYMPPSFIEFKSHKLDKMFEYTYNNTFYLDSKGSIELPEELAKMVVEIGNTKYHLGIGGLHSTEKQQVTIPNENQILVDKDVASYYPSIILNLGLYPEHLGKGFLDVYRKIVNTRLVAKHNGNKVVNESLKIVINGSFGKFGNKYSILYSPDLMMAVTLTGQLSLLMLIEQLEMAGFSVVSANTDGFVTLIDKDRYDEYNAICKEWEKKTNFVLEENRYKALYSRDVNNYLAVTEYGTKGKGIFAKDSLSKNPQASICQTAVEEFLSKDIPVSETIEKCTDITQFLIVRGVKGGGYWNREYLGKAVRWIYSTNGANILYKESGNKVAKSDGARPIMNLPETFPKDIDYLRYCEEAMAILRTLGYSEIYDDLRA